MTFGYDIFCYGHDIDYSFIRGNRKSDTSKSIQVMTHADENILGDFFGIIISDHHLAPGYYSDLGFLDERDVLTYVLEGELTLSDERGAEMVVGEGEVVRFSQKDGVLHDFYNAKDARLLRFIRIGIPAQDDETTQGYETKIISDKDQNPPLRLLASQSGRDGSLTLRSDVDLYVARLNQHGSVRHDLAPGRVAWVQRVKGDFKINGRAVPRGTALKVRDVEKLRIVATSENAELLIFDMAPNLAA